MSDSTDRSAPVDVKALIAELRAPDYRPESVDRFEIADELERLHAMEERARRVKSGVTLQRDDFGPTLVINAREVLGDLDHILNGEQDA